MQPRNAFDQSAEYFRNEWLKSLHFTGFEHLDELTDEHDLFWAVCEWPVFDQSIKQEQAQTRVFGQEQHGAAHQVLMEEVAGLHLMQGNYHIFEECYVFLSQGHCKARDDAGQDVEQLRSTIELEILMNQAIETVVYGFSDHLSSGN